VSETKSYIEQVLRVDRSTFAALASLRALPARRRPGHKKPMVGRLDESVDVDQLFRSSLMFGIPFDAP
jgi:hypothetical protein